MEAIDLSRNPLFNSLNSSTPGTSIDLQYGSFSKEPQLRLVPVSTGRTDNLVDYNMADASPKTNTSTDDNNDDRNLLSERGNSNADSSDRSKGKASDQKTMRRLAQNREAARKSRLRKKAYVQQLENSRLKLTQLELELQQARQQGLFISNSRDQSQSVSGNGAMAFDLEYTRWLEEHKKRVGELRAVVNSRAGDTELRMIVDNVVSQHADIFRMKSNAAKVDVFHILSGMWKTHAERCFMWIGGFCSSELLKASCESTEAVDRATDDCDLQFATVIATSKRRLIPRDGSLTTVPGRDVGEQHTRTGCWFIWKCGKLHGSDGHGEVRNSRGFPSAADNLRQQTLEQMHLILTTRQSARALLAIHDYFARLRALSSLWLARPRE